MKLKLPFFLLVCFICLNIGAQEKLEEISLNLINEKISNLKEDDNYHQNVLNLLYKISPNDSIFPSIMVSKSYQLIQMKRYDDAIKVIDSSFTLEGVSKELLYLNKGVCYEKQDKYDEAIEVYSKALKEYPYNGSFYYNRGVVYQNKDNYKKAFDDYFTSMKIEPFFKNVYYKLGELYYKEKKMSQALMALNMYLLFNPDSNQSFEMLKWINISFSKKNDSKPKNLEITKNDVKFKELDLILNNGIALNEKYKVDHKIKASFVKQNHLLLHQLKETKLNGNDWKRFLDFYNWVSATDNFDNFIYLLAYSNPNEKKLIEKNQDEIVGFFNEAKDKWKSILSDDNIDLSDHTKSGVSYLYNEMQVNAVGKIVDNKKVGEWKALEDSGKPKGAGFFNEAGEKQGNWKWYYPNGIVRVSENYKKGEFEGETNTFYDNGNLKYLLNYKKSKLEGLYKSFNEYGIKTADKKFADGKLTGNYVSYYDLDDAKYFEGNYVDGKLEGEGKFYYDNNEPYINLSYKNDEIDGERKEFYRDGTLKVLSYFKNDVIGGDYISYYNNGKVFEKLNYTDGELNGAGIVYYSDGTLYKEMNYVKGKLNGSYKEYDVDGKLYYDYEYKNDLIVRCQYFNKDQSLLIDSKKKGKGIDFNGFNSLGEITGKGLYNIKGGRQDDWEFYENGVRYNATSYEDDKAQGKSTWYFDDGKVISKGSYKDDELDGYYVKYYYDGKMKEQGYYDNGKYEGIWQTYYPNGLLEIDNFYHKNEKNGISKDFSPTGKLYVASHYKSGKLLKQVYHKENGEIFETINFNKKDKNYKIEYHHFNGKLHSAVNYFGEQKHGDYKSYYFSGEPLVTGQYYNGKKHGAWKKYSEEGKVILTYQYYYGDKVGKWTYSFNDGTTERVENYKNNLEEGLSIYYNYEGKKITEITYKENKRHGTCKTYSLEGDLQLVKYYHTGKLIGYSYEDSSGNLVPTIALKNGTGVVKAFFANGKPSADIEYKNRNRVGNYILYNTNGNIFKSYSYNEVGMPHGEDKLFYLDGSVRKSEHYVFDTLHGEQKKYHKNGKLKSVVSYKYGYKEGEAKEFDTTGKLIKKTNYFHNLITDETTF